MKKLLILLFSLFFLISPSVFADDISDFQIAGISIGDSLLDYMTEEEILEGIEETKDWYSQLKDPYKYSHVFLDKDFPTYDGVITFIENNSTNQYITNKNEKYTILYINGVTNYIEDFDSCIEKRDEIEEVVSKMFPNTSKWEDFYEHSADPSGNSIVDGVFFAFDSGDEIEVSWDNFEETFRIKHQWGEGLNVVISFKEINDWMRNY